MAEISIIVPVYNVEKYINRCIDSILVQTYENFELILVDDGSPDNCGAICDEYTRKDSRIRVIHKKNGGLSSARNAGLDWVFSNSDSRWITLIDSDDWIHPKYLELLLSAVQEHETDISIGTYFRTAGEPFPAINEIEPKLYRTEDYYIAKDVNATVAWGKLYARECFQNIRYPDGKIHEDEYVTYRILFERQYVSVVDAQIYAYFDNTNGITNAKWTPKRMDAIDALEEQVAFFLERGFWGIARLRFSVLLYVIMQNMDKLKRAEDIGFLAKFKYDAFLRRKLKKCLRKYRSYNWITFKTNRTVYVRSSFILSILREIWLTYIKPVVRKT